MGFVGLRWGRLLGVYCGTAGQWGDPGTLRLSSRTLTVRMSANLFAKYSLPGLLCRVYKTPRTLKPNRKDTLYDHQTRLDHPRQVREQTRPDFHTKKDFD